MVFGQRVDLLEAIEARVLGSGESANPVLSAEASKSGQTRGGQPAGESLGGDDEADDPGGVGTDNVCSDAGAQPTDMPDGPESAEGGAPATCVPPGDGNSVGDDASQSARWDGDPPEQAGPATADEATAADTGGAETGVAATAEDPYATARPDHSPSQRDPADCNSDDTAGLPPSARQYGQLLSDLSRLYVGEGGSVQEDVLKISRANRTTSARLERKLRELDDYSFDVVAPPLPAVGEPAFDLWDLRSRGPLGEEGHAYYSILFQNDLPERWRNFQRLGGAEDALETIRYGDTSEVLVDKFGIDMTRGHIGCLDGPHWINDEVINFFISMVQERNDHLVRQGVAKVPSCFCFNTFFFNMLSGGDDPNVCYNYRSVARWTARRKIDVFAVDVLLVPVHAYKAHWCLGMVDMRPNSRRILLFDSMRGSHQVFFRNIRKWLQDEHLDKKKEPLADIGDWKFRRSFESERVAPRQQNGYDCGVFLCMYAECLSIGKKFDFCQRDINNLRVKMIQQILRGSIFE